MVALPSVWMMPRDGAARQAFLAVADANNAMAEVGPGGRRQRKAAARSPVIDRARIALRDNPRGTFPAVEGLADMLQMALLSLAQGRVA